jgi:predicted nuclease of restriction endonuclease-like RecB superfamily
VRFSLQDVRKSVQRRGGTLAVSLHFLRAGELQDEIARLLSYYERLLGQPQRLFSVDEARACIGEYRVAHCLMATLSHWYSWQARSWGDVVCERGGDEHLLALGSSAQLRLLLYSFVNEHYAGFLPASQRATALSTFAAPYGVDTSGLEYLLVLDSDNEALLTLTAQRAPTVQEITALYNQWTFEAALFNASYVHFVIDCNAFRNLDTFTTPEQTGLTNLTDWQASNAGRALSPDAGIGSVIKRLCYLARLLGVYYDLEYEVGTAPLLLHLTLYGPQEVTGVPQQYGLRLARLCRLLLGYGASQAAQGEDGRSARKTSLAAGIVEAEARIHFLQRAYLFAMDARLLQLFPGANASQDGVVSETSGEYASALFDSSIEQTFAEGFSSLARDQGVDGWSLEREPEPLLLERGIFIPDFALTRRAHRVYVEILGFWTPAYRERKLQRLQQLRERNDLLLIIPQDAREAFASIEQDFPIVSYKDQISIADVLYVLRQHYDDFSERLGLIDVEHVRNTIRQRGFIVERECGILLHTYRRAELQQAAARIYAEQHDLADACVYVPGLGIYAQSWLQKLQHTFYTWLAQEQQQSQTVSLSTALAALRTGDDTLRTSPDTLLETLIGLWPEVHIQRDSIFDAAITLSGTSIIESIPLEDASTLSDTESVVPVPSTPKKKTTREQRSSSKKRPVAIPQEIVQGDLWS